MNARRPTDGLNLLGTPPDFSLVLGGPLFRLLHRAHLCDDALLLVRQRRRPLLQQFLERKLIPKEAMPRFEAAIASAFRLRNSVLAELLLIAFVYGGHRRARGRDPAADCAAVAHRDAAGRTAAEAGLHVVLTKRNRRTMKATDGHEWTPIHPQSARLSAASTPPSGSSLRPAPFSPAPTVSG